MYLEWRAAIDGNPADRWSYRLFPWDASGRRGNEPSKIIDVSLRKAAAGLIAAACLQVAVAFVVTRPGYPGWFFPVCCSFLALAAAGAYQLYRGTYPTVWVVALCGLFAVFSLTASWAVHGRYTGALNVAEPLIGLGGFGAGLSPGRWARPAAAVMIAVHRGALALAGTGHLGEHLVLLMIETASLCAAIVGSTIVRGIGDLLNADADMLRLEAVRAAAKETENRASREHPRLVHDAPVHLLSLAGRGEARDSAEFRRACAQGSEWLRGQVRLSEPSWTLAEILDELVPGFKREGLDVHLAQGDVTSYPDAPLVVTALARAVHQALVNVSLHSGSHDAYVTVTTGRDGISVGVRDHGRGFVRGATSGFGSSESIERRMWDVGGQASIDSTVEAGTTVTLTYPRARTATRETATAGRLRRLWQWARTGRWSRQRARQRWVPLSIFMWRMLPYGLAVFTVLNAAQLAIFWPAYRHGPVAVLLLVTLAGMYMLIWYRSPGGVGPLLSALAVATGPVACLVIATQLSQTDLTGLANWVSGFCVVPICLLPFSRPPEEMAVGVASLGIVQGFVMADAGRSLRDLHTIVMSGGAGVAIGISVFFIVAVIRQIDTIGQLLKRQALDATRTRIVREGSRASLRLRVTATETAAAAVLDTLSAGSGDLADPDVQRRCAGLAEDLRRELTSLGSQSLLWAELQPDAGDLRWLIDDELNLSQRFGYEDRILLVRALRGIRELLAEGVAVEVLPLSAEQASVTVVSESAPLPATRDWRVACRRFGVHTRPHATHGPTRDQRWSYQWDMPTDPLPEEAR